MRAHSQVLGFAEKCFRLRVVEPGPTPPQQSLCSLCLLTATHDVYHVLCVFKILHAMKHHPQPKTNSTVLQLTEHHDNTASVTALL